MHEKWTACPIWTIEIPIGIAFFRSEFPITDRISGNPIENLEIRSEIWISDRKSGFPIRFPIFQFSIFFFFVKEKTKKENAFEVKKYPV